MISLHSYLVYTYEQQIYIDEIQVYSRRHIQLSSTRAHSGGQPNIFCFALFHWSERFSEFFSLFFATHGQSISYVKIEKNQIQNLQIKNKEVYKILLESQVKEKPIAYTKWEKCLKKDRMHTLTCITQTLFFTFNYLELNKLKIFKWKLIHFILPCKELLIIIIIIICISI